MKRLLIILLGILFICAGAFADDGLWDNFGDAGIYNPQKQTAVSDEQFDKTVEKVKENKNKGFFNFGKKKKIKGESYQESNETELIKGIDKELPILRVPCELMTDNGEKLPVGHYQAIFEKENDGKLFMNLYQAHRLVGKFRAWETEEDLYDEHLNYITLDEYNSATVKVNYGSMDYNAVVFIKKYLPPETDF